MLPIASKIADEALAALPSRQSRSSPWVNLAPGMAVTLEIETGMRRVIEYRLSPLMRCKQENWGAIAGSLSGASEDLDFASSRTDASVEHETDGSSAFAASRLELLVLCF